MMMILQHLEGVPGPPQFRAGRTLIQCMIWNDNVIHPWPGGSGALFRLAQVEDEDSVPRSLVRVVRLIISVVGTV